VIVIAIKRVDGRVEFPPGGDEAFAPGDSIVLMGQRENLHQFREHFQVSGPGL
jgi:voltage-gated potassium channel